MRCTARGNGIKMKLQIILEREKGAFVSSFVFICVCACGFYINRMNSMQKKMILCSENPQTSNQNNKDH